MSSGWYAEVTAATPVTQGDLIDLCPVIEWDSAGEIRELKAATRASSQDVIVMTQACDLEHGKVENVLLCPRWGLGEYRRAWEADQQAKKQTPSSKSWGKHCDSIRDGFVWNLGLLDAVPGGEVVVVDFHEVFTLPRKFLDSFLRTQNNVRWRLTSPYREHLSQAFARFFMRVGLPASVSKTW